MDNAPIKLVDDFLEFEHSEKLFEVEYKGVKFWHLIRFNVYSELIKSHFEVGTAHTK